MASSCDAAIAAHRRRAAAEGHLHELVDGVRVGRPRGRRTRARSARSRRRSRRTGSRSSRSSTSRAPRTSSTASRTRSCGRSTASASARCGRSADVEVMQRQREARDEPRRARPRAEDRSRARTRCTSSATAPRSATTPTAATSPAASSTAMEHPDALNDDFNLSTAESTTVLELAENIWQQTQRRRRAVPLRGRRPVRPRRAEAGPVGREGAGRCSASRRRRRSTRCSTTSCPGSSRLPTTA